MIFPNLDIARFELEWDNVILLCRFPILSVNWAHSLTDNKGSGSSLFMKAGNSIAKRFSKELGVWWSLGSYQRGTFRKGLTGNGKRFLLKTCSRTRMKAGRVGLVGICNLETRWRLAPSNHRHGFYFLIPAWLRTNVQRKPTPFGLEPSNPESSWSKDRSWFGLSWPLEMSDPIHHYSAPRHYADPSRLPLILQPLQIPWRSRRYGRTILKLQLIEGMTNFD
jgi:hypothetical protein